MIRQLILTLFSLCLFTAASAQTPEPVFIDGKSKTSSALQKMACADQFAGNINHARENEDPIFFCFGDNYTINHEGNQDLTGDPEPATAPGVTYAFYSGPPTISGPDLASVLTDPNLIPNAGAQTPFFVSGSTGDISGNITFMNTGVLQTTPEIGGNGGPLQLWFAPITIDEFATNGYEEDNGIAGPCVNANVAEAFSMVYLNEIQASNTTIESVCEASFTITGGRPEFDGTDYADFIIVSNNNPANLGTVTSINNTHGSVVTFEVPTGGTYTVTVTDPAACGASFEVTFPTTGNLELSASTESVPPGSAVCVDIIAEDFFDDIVSMQMTIDYDETILDFTSFQNFNPNLPGMMSSLNDNGNAILMSWFDPPLNGVTLADGEILFQICFDVIGTGGDVSPITFNESEVSIEITNPCGAVTFSGTDGEVEVTLEAFGVDVDVTDETCAGEEDGTFTVTATGGQAPYNITWTGINTGTVGGPAVINTNGGSFMATGLQPDAYTIVITDNLGAVVNESASIADGLGLGATINAMIPTCFEDCNGSLTVQVSENGVIINNPGPEYSFQWSNMETTQTINNLCGSATNFSVTVTGPNNCSATASGALSTPSEIQPGAMITDATCSGQNDGQIQLNITGGTPTYTSAWPGLGLTNSVNIVDASDGIYENIITDMNGCVDTFFHEVGAVKVLSLDETLTELLCSGDSNGEISVVASTSGGTSNSYDFNWIGAPPPGPASNTANTSTISNLETGIYQVFLTDDEGCQTDETFNLTEPDSIAITLIETINETCTTGNDGAATVGVTGGIYPYTYDWGIVGQADSTLSNVTAGIYTLTLTDDNACSQTFEVEVGAPQPPIVTALLDDTLDCADDTDGTLTIETTPGSAPISEIEWSTGSNDATITGLAPGEYQVTVTAEDGCFTLDTALVIAPDTLSVTSLTTTPTNCPGQGGGAVAIIVEGGTPDYVFEWSTGLSTVGTGSNISGGNITAGVYSVTVSDANGCPSLVQNDIIVEDPPSIEADFTDINPVSCFNSAGVPPDGGATIVPFYEDDPANNQGQTWFVSWQTLDNPPTIFLQENGVFTSTANNLPQDEQFIIVSDGQCADTFSVNIPSPPPLVATGTAESVSCFGDTDGSVTVIAEGGTEPYTYQWSTGDVDVTTVDNLPPGEVSTTIFDANNCTFTFLSEVDEPDPFVAFLLLESQDSVSCFEGNDAIISIGTSGGNPGVLTYTWEGDIADPSESVATGVGPGSYAVTVTDERGCSDELTTLISQPEPITFEFSVDTITCNGGNAIIQIDTVMGGTVDNYVEYTYQLNINPNPLQVTFNQNIGAGDYTISVFDVNGCEVRDSFLLTEPNPLSVDLPDLIEIELGDTTTQLNPVVINDLPLDSIIWTPATGLSSDTILNPFIRNSIDDGTYKLTLVDINGCMGMDQVDIEIDRNRNIYIPNVFSPNNDGFNDDFGVFGCLGTVRVVQAQVYDRWGELVAAIDDTPTECISPNGTVIWDGTFRGRAAADGVYVYFIEIEFLDERRLVYRGDVTVLK